MNIWDERYADVDYLYGTEPNDFLVSVAERIPPGPVLSLAEGEGRNAVYLAGRGHRVTAVDASAVGMRKAQRLAAARGLEIETRVADLAEFHIVPNSWSGIISIWAHVPALVRARLYPEVVAGLVPGGAFILEAYTPAQIPRGTGGPKDPDRLPDLTGLRSQLAGLQLVIGREVEREVHEGRPHQGMSAVLQVLAVRPPVDGADHAR